MSKIGKKPIEIPQEVMVEVRNGEVRVSGPKGSLSQKLPSEIEIKIRGNQILVSQKTKLRVAKTLQGTIRNLLANMIKGVKEGWSKTLEIEGTGFRAALSGERLSLSLGFSHPIEVVPPPGISFSVVEKKIQVLGADKALVGRVASRIRGIKPPDAYKGKGIHYEGEEIKLKPGKQVKVGIAGVGAPGGGSQK